MTSADVAPAIPDNEIRRAAGLLHAGELVGMPTETVYGLAADALNVAAVGKIFAAKGRPADHPLIVHLPDAGHLARWAREIPDDAFALARAFWPGPLTLILKRQHSVPDALTGGQDTVGLRVPDHPVALALLQTFDSGIAAPSANRFGRISPTTAEHVRQELGDKIALILDGGPCVVGIESTILDLSRDTPQILRPGAISAEDIARVIGCPPRSRPIPTGEASAGDHRDGATGDGEPRVSGSLSAHYAPRTPLQMTAASQLAELAATLAAEGSRVAVLAYGCQDPQDARLIWRAAPLDAAGYAHALYANLRDLDACGADFIVVETPPATPDWQAVNDRLRRAAAGSGDADET
ncbi:L-threonylcarbamoyladenylate synthase [Aromatoleum aromaticum]|uniref:Threonylcarbamoyl-AMP synthase n=1 Tax=Aromatoleum aromaticum (strain DSM 19018 / LMG 30748 / EbN1) TaxID=76114 RepID=Q5P925_AROAE|nr:L-threonylcarbamoyladenylate synthase [Aromatoleum aromaticum]NMG56221.1 threonylcarbamoyl-AMP synthase [Aromatoleum aromaticum]CAI06184.1 putative translation factor (SUA5) [Aromatoleum aromaticum EbN1]